MLLLIILLALFAQPMAAPTTGAVPNADGSGAYLITMGPGDEAWEKFGHNMLWIRDPARQIDIAFNWGLFDFEEKNFIWNFVQGRLLYWMDGFDAQRTIDVYLNDDRTIWVQELHLSAAQRQALWDFCRWNAQESNRYYRYDYFQDNCSTRVRDAIDGVLGGQIKRRATMVPSDVTYRSETLRLTADDVPLYTALDFVLGHPTDRKLSAYEEMFIPLRMRQRFNELTITDESGHEAPLVKSEVVLHTSKRVPLRTAPPNRMWWFLIVGIAIGAGMSACGLAITSERKPNPQAIWRHRATKWTFIVLTVFWSLLSGLGGAILTYLWVLTDHAAVRPNENILQLSPAMLPMVLLAPLALRGRRKLTRIGLLLAELALVASVLGLVLKILPAMYQPNANIIALALPANAGMAWAMWMMRGSGRENPKSETRNSKQARMTKKEK